MDQLRLPTYPFKVKTEKGASQIFDEFRNKWVVLTPEEWVRQHLLIYLRDHLDFPAGLTGVEVGISINGLERRCDIVYFRKDGSPFLIVECKRPDVKIDQSVFDQVFRYNQVIKGGFVLLSNGLRHFLVKVDGEKGPEFMNSIPNWHQLQEA